MALKKETWLWMRRSAGTIFPGGRRTPMVCERSMLQTGALMRTALGNLVCPTSRSDVGSLTLLRTGELQMAVMGEKPTGHALLVDMNLVSPK
jgi:hypothetical protein